MMSSRRTQSGVKKCMFKIKVLYSSYTSNKHCTQRTVVFVFGLASFFCYRGCIALAILSFLTTALLVVKSSLSMTDVFERIDTVS